LQNTIELLTSLQGQQSHARKIDVILEWTLAGLSAEGVALLEAEAAPSQRLSVQAALGSLTTAAESIAALWSRTGLPQMQGMIALPAGTGNTDVVLARPVDFQNGAAWSVLVLHGANIEETAREAEADLLLVTLLLRETLEKERMRRQIEREMALAALLDGKGGSAHPGVLPAGVLPAGVLPGITLLTDALMLPLYVCDERGLFIYASPAFLALTGYPTLAALSQRAGFFAEPSVRADELSTARSVGKVTSFPIAVISGSGARLEIRDSAVAMGDSFFGVFFDVTALMAANAELKDTLQVQELLNDSILAGTKTLQRTQGAAIRTLARLAEYRDPETGFHLQRICEYSRLLATQVYERAPYSFRITREYGDDISMSSMLHDIGKVSIPDSILLKPDRLDPGEWETMKKHTIFGWEVLHKADRELGEQSFLTLAATIALSHHEKYDGTGYPYGSAGEQIPLSARISALADVYDALTSARPYKEAWSHERAMEEIVGQARSHFDPVLVEIFQSVHGQFAEVRRLFPG
jgi:HD-GYP domain-containing protein (c-di-GMP phosphodiesterase class II)